EARGFWKPLIPAHEGTDLAVFRVVRLEAQITRGEIELFVIKWIVGYVHLSILAGRLSRGVDDHSRVVIDAGRPLFKDRSNYDDLFLPRYFAQSIRGWTGYCFG